MPRRRQRRRVNCRNGARPGLTTKRTCLNCQASRHFIARKPTKTRPLHLEQWPTPAKLRCIRWRRGQFQIKKSRNGRLPRVPRHSTKIRRALLIVPCTRRDIIAYRSVLRDSFEISCEMLPCILSELRPSFEAFSTSVIARSQSPGPDLGTPHLRRRLVEPRGFEPLTSAVRLRRSPN